MKSNNLTYGSIVRLKGDGKVVRVCTITRKKMGYHLRDNESYMHYIQLSEVEPIGICPDSLSRNGFSYDERHKCYCLDYKTVRADEEGLEDYDECVFLHPCEKDDNGDQTWYLSIFTHEDSLEYPTRIEKRIRYEHELQELLVVGNVIKRVEDYKL